MAIVEKTYPALRVKQTVESEWLVMFSASSYEINDWSGVPQKQIVDGTETTGFQRDVKKERLESLISFYNDKKNIIQNPLLCAYKSIENCSVEFVEKVNGGVNVQVGELKLKYDNYKEFSLLDILRKVQFQLEERVPSLKSMEVNPAIIKRIKENFSSTYDDDENAIDLDTVDDTSSVSIDETHIADFWQEVKARITVLEERDDNEDIQSLNGFTKDALVDYLKPVVVVDGQHRLKGAIEAAKFEINNSEIMRDKIAEDILNGEDDEVSFAKQMLSSCRHLPVSLIMDTDPAEHVFQFVVVNQKATPINKALLGTIVSTTLSNEEIERVEKRLEEADIPLEDSRSISFITRNESSPFQGLVQTGISGEDKDKLQWSVMRSLINVVKNLKGGKLYHEDTDYADLWRRRVLTHTHYECLEEDQDQFSYWSSEDGLWREFFIVFWTKVRDYFGDVTDKSSNNFWGKTGSNLFNKVSLTILISDYFKHLATTKTKIHNSNDINSSIDDWLDGVNPTYFNRDWKVSGVVKKDVPPIRKQWSKIWAGYRVDPSQLPSVNGYSKNFQA